VRVLPGAPAGSAAARTPGPGALRALRAAQAGQRAARVRHPAGGSGAGRQPGRPRAGAARLPRRHAAGAAARPRALSAAARRRAGAGLGVGAARRARPAGQAGRGGGDHRRGLARRQDLGGRSRTAAHDLRRVPLPAAAGARKRLSRGRALPRWANVCAFFRLGRDMAAAIDEPAGSGRVARLRAALAESPPLLWSFLYFFCLLSGYYVLRPVREAMVASSDIGAVFPPVLIDFFARRGVSLGEFVPQFIFTAVFLVMLALQPVYGWLVSRFPRRVFLPVIYGF